jgi:basic amino acid/polyamine antiporter, APA family
VARAGIVTGLGPELARRLGTTDAIVIGLGSMIGAGVFSAFAPAAAAAGAGLVIGLRVAAAVAFCNATASAQLAATYPTSGGTYVYGRERLGPWWGFLAGWGFVIGKTASCAAMTLTFAAYAVPPAWQRPVAVAAAVVLAAVNYRGGDPHGRAHPDPRRCRAGRAGGGRRRLPGRRPGRSQPADQRYGP